MPTTPLIPKIPPLRTDIQEPQQSSAVNRPPAQGASSQSNAAPNGGAPQHRTSKEWYYYWSAVGEQVVQNTQTLNGLVIYGPHASRPDPSTMPNGALAVESDRGGVIYQNEFIQGAQAWRYLAGTMWGSLSPDTRPTDLGVNDAGFTFRGTDKPYEYIWSGSQWVQAPSIDYLVGGALIGTRQALNLIAGANVTLGGADNAAARRVDITIGGPAVPQAGDVQQASSSAGLTLTTAATAVPGATITLNRAGRYLITGNFYFNMLGDPNIYLRGNLIANGATQPNQALFQAPNSYEVGGSTQQWIFQASAAGQTVYLAALKDSGTGTSQTMSPFTSITAQWISP